MLCVQGGRYGAAGVRLAEKRRSPILEISLLLAECIQHGLRTIAFCKTRKVCELVTSYTREVLKETAPALVSRIAVYRCASFFRLCPSARNYIRFRHPESGASFTSPVRSGQ